MVGVAAGAAIILPAAGFLLLLAAPALDVRWEHHPSHFWLVVAAAAVTAALAYATGSAADRRGDLRLFGVSIAFLAAGSFLALHALATPGVLLDSSNRGFLIAVPVGLVIASVAAAASALVPEAGSSAVATRAGRIARAALVVLIAVWAVATVAGFSPLAAEARVERASGAIAIPAVVGAVLFAAAAVRFGLTARARGAILPLTVAIAFVLLAEAILATAFARNWHATWWEWHLLILAAFALVAVAARREWREERFSSLYTSEVARGSREVTVVFADLAGFTAFAEGRDPAEVSEMLDAYFEAAIPPIVREHGGTIDKLIGDAVMATFNLRGDQPDHAERAARAAIEIRDRTADVARAHPDWPRFRIGVNTGVAIVGVVGAAGGRSYTVIGDAVNVASRLESSAPAGAVVIGPETRSALRDAETEPLGELEVKGRTASVHAHLLHGVR
ncbi:MAG TPA: adenylate/guanylate cyclase domain-containing protein [Solirubrobacterales bacterium]|nr:adenylate/guanylate cyclase domain-containing protein [Solirubrobacterales bacterium]